MSDVWILYKRLLLKSRDGNCIFSRRLNHLFMPAVAKKDLDVFHQEHFPFSFTCCIWIISYLPFYFRKADNQLLISSKVLVELFFPFEYLCDLGFLTRRCWQQRILVHCWEENDGRKERRALAFKTEVEVKASVFVITKLKCPDMDIWVFAFHHKKFVEDCLLWEGFQTGAGE